MTAPGPMDPLDLEAALALAREALAAAPAALLTDLDGTLAPIVADPGSVQAAPGAVEALARLGSRLAVVAIISGRGAEDVRQIIGTDRVLVVGNHGLEWLEPGAARPTPAPNLSAAAESVERALASVPHLRGVSAEHKGLSATVHFRNAPDPEAAALRVRAALEAANLTDIELRAGRMSLELRPADAGDKGTAVHALVRRNGLRGLLVMGDDVTDLDMFRAAAELRAAGRVRAAILAVSGGREVPAAVRDAADALLPDPAAAVELLSRL